jgi:hypothetical protein
MPLYVVLELQLDPLQFGVIDGAYNGLALALLGLVASQIGIVSTVLLRRSGSCCRRRASRCCCRRSAGLSSRGRLPWTERERAFAAPRATLCGRSTARARH